MRYSVFVFFLLLNHLIISQTVKDSVKWMDIEDVGIKFKEIQKPVMIYFYKNDCDSCREIEKITFSKPEVADYINILFYPVKIDAELKDSIKFFDGRYYKNTGLNGALNDLAVTLGAVDTFPSLVLFSRRAAGKVFKGYFDRDEIFRPLIYYAEDIDVNTEYNDWYKYHVKGYPPGQSQIITRLKIRWKTNEEVKELNKAETRKIFLNLYNYNKISCTLFSTQTINQPDIAAYLNERFYPINIDVFTQDTIYMRGVKYINENKSYKYHQLPIAALEGKMIFPAFLILDEQGNVLVKFQEYMTPEKFEKIIYYYGEDKYKTEDFETFLKTFKSNLKL